MHVNIKFETSSKSLKSFLFLPLLFSLYFFWSKKKLFFGNFPLIFPSRLSQTDLGMTKRQYIEENDDDSGENDANSKQSAIIIKKKNPIKVNAYEPHARWRSFWDTAVPRALYLLEPVDIFFDSARNKKINKHPGGKDHEIKFLDAGLFMLDLDCKCKREQREFFAGNPKILEFLKTQSLYLESTVSGGYHVFVNVKDVPPGFSATAKALTLSHEDFVVEFKQTCCVWPSRGFSRILPSETDPLIYDCSGKNDVMFIVLNCMYLAGGTTEKILFDLFRRLATFFYMDHDKTTFDLILRRISPPPPEFSPPPPHDQPPPQPSTESGEDVASESDADDEIDELSDNEDASATASSGAFPRMSTVFDGDDDEPTISKNYTANDIFIPFEGIVDFSKYEKSQEEFLKVKSTRHELVTNEVLNNVTNDRIKYLVDDDHATTPTNIMHKTFLSRLYTEILKNLISEHGEDQASFHFTDVSNYYDQLEQELSKDKPLCTIYGDDVRIFLEMMICSDTGVNESRSKNDYSGVFSTLCEFRKWNNWAISYCQLVMSMELVNRGSMGKNSAEKISTREFEIYRMVTLRNSVGGRHSDEEDLQEYGEKKREAKENFHLSPIRTSSCFGYFILTTLACMRVTKKVISGFAQFVQYMSSRITDNKTKMINMIKSIFFNIKLRNVSFRVHVVDGGGGSEYGKLKKLAYFWIQNLHLHGTDSEFFDKMMKMLFPNTDHIAPAIENLTSNMSYEDASQVQQYGGAVEIKMWNNMFPFVNGVFDFLGTAEKRYENKRRSRRKKHYSEISPDAFDELRQPASSEPRSSMFRNYHYYDGVTDPINKVFDIEGYLRTFKNTHILSLDNEARYTKEFCLFMRGTFGTSPEEGLMGPYNYENLTAFMFMMALGILRTNSAQCAVILYGENGANGKSELVQMFDRTFGSKKFAKITAPCFFSESDINQQAHQLQETMCLYAEEVNKVNKDQFKDKICGGKVVSRGIYQPVDRENNHIHSLYVFCTNVGLDYKSMEKTKDFYGFDMAFLRRCFLIKFLNYFQNKGEERTITTLLMKVLVFLIDLFI